MAGVAYTYATLTTALQDLLEDSFSDFTGFEDQLIGWGESKLIKDLGLELWDITDTSVSTVSGNALVSKPAGTISVKGVTINGVPLEPRSGDFIEDYNLSASNGQPRYFNEANETQIEVAPKPNAIMSVTYDLVDRPTQLSGATTTTFLSTYYGDLLVLACLIECERFELSDERIPVWQAAYAEKLPGAQSELAMSKRAFGFGPPMPVPAVPGKG